MWAQVGWIQPGDLSFSPSRHARRINDFDRITLTTSIPVDGQVITRGVTTPHSPRPPDLKANEDLLILEAGRREAVLLEDVDGREYDVPSYVLIGRKIIWTEGAGPPLGKSYSVKYEAYPEYIAWTTPFDRWDRQRELGQRAMLRRAVVEFDPAGRQIRPPWEVLLEEDPMSKRETGDKYGILGFNSADPPR